MYVTFKKSRPNEIRPIGRLQYCSFVMQDSKYTFLVITAEEGAAEKEHYTPKASA
jgi:hypothetical protein